MSDYRTSDGTPTGLKLRMDRRTVLGVLSGGAVLVGSMLLLAAMAVLFGWIQPAATGFLDLGPWLVLEVLGGAAASVLAGWVCRNISLRFRGPAVLALVVCSVGLLEAAEILRYLKGNPSGAPVWLVLSAPFVAASGILLGGFRRSQRDTAFIAPLLTTRLPTWWRYAVPTTVLLAATLLALFVLPKHEMEAIALHVLVSQWSNIAAWILTGLTGYTVIWCAGDYRAFTARPILLTPTDLHVRVGLRWEISVAIDSIFEIQAHRAQTGKSSEALSAVVFGKPNLCLKLRHPVEVIGMYGIRKITSEIWMQVDEADRLYSELQAGLKSR